MVHVTRSLRRLAIAFAAGAFTLVQFASAASAQPSYAVPAEEQIRGQVAQVDGAYHLRLHDERGYYDSVELHHGTIINPTGLTIVPGMYVTILGYNGGSSFEANEVDTAYSYGGPSAYGGQTLMPTPVYYGPGWGYPTGVLSSSSLSIRAGSSSLHLSRSGFGF